MPMLTSIYLFILVRRPQSAVNCSCTTECCRNSTSPYQPCNQAVIESTQQHQVGKKTKTRVLNTNLYKDFRWIHVCVTRKKVYCYYCSQCYKRGVLSFTKKYDSAFILDGFQNWKKGREHLERHEKTECHKGAVLKLTTMQGPQHNSETRRTQATCRNMLLKQLSSLKYYYGRDYPFVDTKRVKAISFNYWNFRVMIVHNWNSGLMTIITCHMIWWMNWLSWWVTHCCVNF